LKLISCKERWNSPLLSLYLESSRRRAKRERESERERERERRREGEKEID